MEPDEDKILSRMFTNACDAALGGSACVQIARQLEIADADLLDRDYAMGNMYDRAGQKTSTFRCHAVCLH